MVSHVGDEIGENRRNTINSQMAGGPPRLHTAGCVGRVSAMESPHALRGANVGGANLYLRRAFFPMTQPRFFRVGESLSLREVAEFFG